MDQLLAFWREQLVDSFYFFHLWKVPTIDTSAPPFIPPDDILEVYEGFHDWDSNHLGGGSNFCHPDDDPTAPRMRIVPLPFVVPGDITAGCGGETTFEGENDGDQTSFATAKPKIIEDETQSEVSWFFFTPPRIMLYHNGLDNSQQLRLPPAQGVSMTVQRAPEKRSSSLR